MRELNEEFLEKFVFPIIGYAGESKSLSYEALYLAKDGKFDESDELIERANSMILKAHELQSELITKEANGENIEITTMFVHAQDHLMTALSEKTLIKEMIDMIKLIKNKS